MKATHHETGRRFWAEGLLLLGITLFTTACSRPDTETYQGYVEGEVVYIASPLSGTLETLSVERGMWVEVGNPLFVLESGAEEVAKDLAEWRLAEGQARLQDARKGMRLPELASLKAQMEKAEAALVFSEMELARVTRLYENAVVPDQDLDRARSIRDQDHARVEQLEAELKTAQLGSREDFIAAAEANVRALEAALAKADWDLTQKRRDAPRNGLVTDILYRSGDWVAAGRPVLTILPPEQRKVRAYIPETRIAGIQTGDDVAVYVDGIEGAIVGKVSFISPNVEYTPPVIYSEDTRSKLVFMIEVTFHTGEVSHLHPGQPVEIQMIAAE